MIKEINAFGWRFVFFAKKIHKTAGVNSVLRSGGQAIFFDFDGVSYRTVEQELLFVQEKYNLPSITVVETGRPNSYHAYCFRRTPLRQALQICLDCPSIDKVFLMMALKRGWFTLRISQKNGRKINYLTTLHSNVPADCNSDDLSKFTIYETGAG